MATRAIGAKLSFVNIRVARGARGLSSGEFKSRVTRGAFHSFVGTRERESRRRVVERCIAPHAPRFGGMTHGARGPDRAVR